VLVNLLDNALKYSNPGSEIKVVAQREGEEVVVSVSDRGSGIPREGLTKVFDQFYRGESPEHVSGTGLGLTICKALVEAHGGRIWVESEAGHGATFSFSLPVPAEAPGGIPVPGEVESDGGSPSAHPGRR
ncbi:MAG: sensor histidine kinase, partial [Methanocella sp.]